MWDPSELDEWRWGQRPKPVPAEPLPRSRRQQAAQWLLGSTLVLYGILHIGWQYIPGWAGGVLIFLVGCSMAAAGFVEPARRRMWRSSLVFVGSLLMAFAAAAQLSGRPM